MNRTDIEWVQNPDGSQGYTCNPIKGYCPMACPYCYARRLYNRFGWDKAIRYDVDAWRKGVNICRLKKPTRIFMGSTIELFGLWVEDWWMEDILATVRTFPQHTFIFLTKQPWELSKWNPWPDNAWVGVTLTHYDDSIINNLKGLSNCAARFRFVSFEPLLGSMSHLDFLQRLAEGIDWFIIGAQTQPYRSPRREWVQEIIDAADRAGIPIFQKNNLKPLLGENLRQEMPRE